MANSTLAELGLDKPSFAARWGTASSRGAALAKEWLVPGVFGVVAGRAMLPGEAYPLAVAYVVALLALKDWRRAAAATAGVLLAMAPAVAPFRLAEQMLIFVMAWFLAAILSSRDEGDSGRSGDGRKEATRRGLERWVPAYRLALFVFGGTLLLRGGMLYVLNAGPEAMAWAGGESLLELGATLVLLPAASLHSRRATALEGHHLAGLVLALGGLAWATTPIAFGALSVGHIIVMYGVIVLAFGSGAALSAPAGAGLGVLIAAAGAPTEVVGFLALAGLAAGIGRRWGKAGTIAGVLAGCLATSLLGAYPADTYTWLTHGVIAGVLLLITPGRWLDAWAKYMGSGEDAPVPTPAALSGSPGQHLLRLSAVFDELADAFGSPAAEGETGAEQREEAMIRLFVEGVTERICRGCSAYRYCWEDHGQESFEDFARVARIADKKGKLALRDFPESLRRRCIKERTLLRSAAETLQLLNLHRDWERRYLQCKELVPQQLRGVGRLVRDMAVQLEQPRRGAASGARRATARGPQYGAGPASRARRFRADEEEHRPRLQLEATVVQRAKDGSLVCGDSDARIDLGGGKVALVLSDGMGAGERAALESRAVVGLLRRLLEAGFDRQFAVKMVNSVLLVRSGEETFATIDMAIVDLVEEQVEFLKIGAPPTFIKRGSRVLTVRGAALPVGILQQVDVDVQRYRLQTGDVIVMMTDGLIDHLARDGDGEAELAAIVRSAPAGEPGDLAREMMACLDEEKLKDDVTLLVAAIEPAEPELPTPERVSVFRRRS